MSGRFVQLVVLVMVGVHFVGGCIDDEKTVVIYANIPPDPENECELTVQTVGESLIYLPYGLLDLNHPIHGDSPTYHMNPQVHNYMPSNLDSDNNRLDSMSVDLTSATIRYEWLKGRDNVLVPGAMTDLLNLESSSSTSTFYLNARVSAASKEGEPGQTLTYVLAIPPEVGTFLKAMGESNVDKLVLGLHLRFIGATVGGSSIETNDFLFPVYFCWGCLSVTCCAGAQDAYYPSCTPGQDGTFLGPCECATATP